VSVTISAPAQEFHNNRDYLGPRKWSPLALWRFREFNELPRIFEQRCGGAYARAVAAAAAVALMRLCQPLSLLRSVNASYEPANVYERQFPTPVLSVVGRCVSYVTGSIVSVLLLLTLLDERILLYVRVWDRNLLWYIAVLSAVLAVSRVFVPSPEDEVLNPDGAMKKARVGPAGGSSWVACCVHAFLRDCVYIRAMLWCMCVYLCVCVCVFVCVCVCVCVCLCVCVWRAHTRGPLSWSRTRTTCRARGVESATRTTCVTSS
jgi:hypothetical protein